ncbi:MAG: hypothetical protein FH756_02665 [Firmicutes bacterium]|nr:hypothetical protein [Bacillota bacterium]
MGRYLMILIIGVLVGASVTNIMIGKQIDNLHISNQALRQQLSVSERELQSLKESLEKNERQIITGIEVEVGFVGEELTGYEESSAILTAEESVEDWLKVIKGQEINDVNYMLIPEIIDGRAIQVDGRKFNISVKLVVLTKTVIVYLEAEPVSANEE